MRSDEDEKSSRRSTRNPDPPSGPPRVATTTTRRARFASLAWRVLKGLRVHHAASAAEAMAFHFFLSLIPLLVLAGYVLGLVVRRRGVDAVLGPALEQAPESRAGHRAPRARTARRVERRAARAPVGRRLPVARRDRHARPDGRPRERGVGAASIVVEAAHAGARVGDDGARRARRGRLAAAQGRRDAPPARTRAPARGGRKAAAVDPRQSGRSRARSRGPLVRRDCRARRVLPLCRRASPGVERRAWPGAVAAFAAWLVVSWVFGAYVSQLASYALYYGGLAAVAVLIGVALPDELGAAPRRRGERAARRHPPDVDSARALTTPSNR